MCTAVNWIVWGLENGMDALRHKVSAIISIFYLCVNAMHWRVVIQRQSVHFKLIVKSTTKTASELSPTEEGCLGGGRWDIWAAPIQRHTKTNVAFLQCKCPALIGELIINNSNKNGSTVVDRQHRKRLNDNIEHEAPFCSLLLTFAVCFTALCQCFYCCCLI